MISRVLVKILIGMGITPRIMANILIGTGLTMTTVGLSAAIAGIGWFCALANESVLSGPAVPYRVYPVELRS
jgi:hypothetical protein